MSKGHDTIMEHDQLIRHMNITLDEASKDFARLYMPLTDHHRNGWGAAHGGAICSLADAAFGVAANYDSDYAVVTISTSIDFLRPGIDGPLKAEARAVHRGGKIVNYDVEIFDAHETLIARGMLAGYLTSLKVGKD